MLATVFDGELDSGYDTPGTTTISASTTRTLIGQHATEGGARGLIGSGSGMMTALDAVPAPLGSPSIPGATTFDVHGPRIEMHILESRDNPFRPEGDLSKEVAPIVEAYKLKNPAASPLSSPEPATPDPLPPTPPVTPEAEIVVDVGAVELESAPPTTPTPTKSPTSPQNGAAASNGKSTAASPSSGENGAVADAEDVARRTDKKKDVDGCCQKCAVM